MKKIVSLVLSVVFIMSLPVAGFAEKQEPQTDMSGFSPIQHYLEQEGINKIKNKKDKSGDVTIQSSQAKEYSIPGGKGTLTSNTWRSTFSTKSGNTLQWDYQVSAVYDGTWTVERIRTTWQGSANLRNSASISLGISGSGVSASSSESWQNIKTVAKYWENTNGATMSWYSSNMIVSPEQDYQAFTIALVNTALVKLNGDNMVYQISSGV
ncbi:hypothetical protein [Tepidibacillus decaturensis]|uniref:Uncharacterized protein n=1 Tax=Tepidibacillus decaturensis TaxID=1413211 RepID=A0A135L437_9BACI|nr:hypothetical protein [Tepidibacillus decaturensis]KXG43746.1 hypothetical protein U473_06765 [Tepidibacillus decaturensis]